MDRPVGAGVLLAPSRLRAFDHPLGHEGAAVAVVEEDLASQHVRGVERGPAGPGTRMAVVIALERAFDERSAVPFAVVPAARTPSSGEPQVMSAYVRDDGDPLSA